MYEIKLGDDLTISAPFSEGKRFAVVGKSGAGKTNSLLVLTRELIMLGWTVVVIDPMNAYRALRDVGLPVLVAGTRQSADVQIDTDNAPLLADFSFDQRASVVVNLSTSTGGMETLRAFLARLWERITNQPEDGPFVPFALVIDEARLYVPQGGKTAISDLIVDMAQLGRQLHLSMVVATQRPANVDKNFLTQYNVMLFHALRGVDIQPLKDELAMPEKAARVLMRRFGKGQAVVVGDPDMVEIEDDYLVAQVRQWDGQALIQPLADQSGPRTIDTEALAALRQALAKPVEREEDKDALIAALRQQVADYETQIAQLTADLEAARQVPISVEVKPVLPNELAVQQMHVGQMVGLPQFAVVPERDLPAIAQEGGGKPTPVPSDEWDGRSPLATQRAIKRQRNQFSALIETIKRMSTMHRRILVYLTQRESLSFEEPQLVRFVGYSLSSIQKQRPTDAERLGLIKRTLNANKTQWVYQSSVRQMFTEQYPDLDTDDLVQVVCKLEKV